MNGRMTAEAEAQWVGEQEAEQWVVEAPPTPTEPAPVVLPGGVLAMLREQMARAQALEAQTAAVKQHSREVLAAALLGMGVEGAPMNVNLDTGVVTLA